MTFYKVNVANKDEIQNAYDAIIKDFKFLDYVINCAGILKDNSIEDTISVNVNGVIYSSFIAREYMRTDKGGRGGFIVNVSSLSGLGPINCMPVYSASKHAVTGFTRAMGHENHYKQTGIKYLTMCPGGTITPIGANIAQTLWDSAWIYNMKRDMPIQTADALGPAVVHAIKKDKNGSVWLCEEGLVREIEFQDPWQY